MRIRLFRFSITAAVLVVAVAGGCRKDVSHFREVKRIHEKVSESELQRYLRVVEQLPDKKVPVLSVYRPLPNWNPRRTLPVDELLNEERKLLERGWDVEWHAEQLKRNRHLARAVQRENMTVQQFVGLTLALGAALGRSRLRQEQQPEALLEKGRAVTAKLSNDERTFAKLSPEERFTVQRNAGWLTRLDRASRLTDVPPENIALVNKHRKQLESIFPREFLDNQLDDIADLLEVQGTPFEELDASGRDKDLTWDRESANIGYDKPNGGKGE